MSAKISKASKAHIKKVATAASRVLSNSDSTVLAKTSAGKNMAAHRQVRMGGKAYVVRDFDVESTHVSSARSVNTIKDGASKYSKALRRLAKK